ncbi:hypothetical protein GQ53DRAFT_818812 [Thozetella sp. PMI_491]|nr:hypothetical protein GQ53DRAFT_818812 [Thozetella sp. PMI_491]
MNPPLPSSLRRANTASDDSTLYRRESPAATIASIIIALASIVSLSSFLTQKILSVKSWQRLPPGLWLVFAIYGDSLIFVFATEILRNGLGIDSNLAVCDAAILLCLVFYVSSKLIYMFLVEKAHIIQVTKHRRMQSKLYLFNAFGLLGAYMVIVILNFVFRIARLQDGQCIIGMQKGSMIPLISFDVLINTYLTVLDICLPKRHTYSSKYPTPQHRNANLHWNIVHIDK